MSTDTNQLPQKPLVDKQGFIKLSRKLQNWRWYSNSNLVHLWIELLFRASYAPREYNGKPLDRGQCVITYPSLAKSTGISIQTLRTCLGKLKSTGELTVKLTAKYSIVTIVNYNEYQMRKQRHQQAYQQSNQQSTNSLGQDSISNDLLKKERKNIYPEHMKDLPISIATYERCYELYGQEDTDEQACMALDYIKATGKTYKDYDAFFRNWMRRSKNGRNNHNRESIEEKFAENGAFLRKSYV